MSDDAPSPPPKPVPAKPVPAKPVAAKPVMAKSVARSSLGPDGEADADDAPKPNPVRYPGAVRLVGVIWLLLGVMQVASGLVAVATAGQRKVDKAFEKARRDAEARATQPAGNPAPSPPSSDAAGVPNAVADVLPLVLGGVLVAVGLLTVSGYLWSAKVAGIASLALAVVPLIRLVLDLLSDPSVLSLALSAVLALGLLIAGVLAVRQSAALRQHRRWENERKAVRDAKRAVAPIRPVRYPGGVRAAGIIWLLMGLFQVLFSLFMVMAADDLKKYSGLSPANRELVQTGLYISAGVVAVIGIAFTVTGLQAVTGATSSVKGAGVVSMLLASLPLIGAGRELFTTADPILVGAGVLQFFGYLVSGFLAVNGSAQFRAWRSWMAQKADVKKHGKGAATSGRAKPDGQAGDAATPAKPVPGRPAMAKPVAGPTAEADEPDADDVPKPKPVRYPGAVKTAGVIWLVIGLAYFAWIGLAYFAVVNDAPDPAKRNIPTQTRPAGASANQEAALTAVYVMMGVAAVFGLIFTVVGIQAITGAVSSILGSGLGSIFLGVLALVGAVSLILSDNTAVIPAAIGSFVLAFGLMLAGGLAASGATQFKKWRKWKKETAGAKKAKPRKATPRDEE